MFNKSSVIFILVNIVRALSVVGICLAFSGEIVTIVNNIQGIKAAVSASSSTTAAAPSQTSFVAQTRSVGILYAREIRPTSNVYAVATKTGAAAISVATRPVSGSSFSSTSDRTTTSMSSISDSTSASPDSGYVGNTDVPLQFGGALTSTLSRVLCCILLLFTLVAEMPPPSSYTQRFWNYAFPPFGNQFGVGVLGGLQIFIGCIMLSHTVYGFPLVAGWFLFSIGFINVLFGLAFGHSLKTTRAIFSAGERDEEPGSYYVYNPDSKPKPQGGMKKGIQISSPIYSA